MDGKSYTPGGDFLSTMKWYSKYPGISCQFAPCEYATPDHSVLSRFQLNYYLWWRKKLKEGVFMKTSPGYVWLRVCELINVEDPGEGLRELELFKANAGYCGLSPDDIEKTAAELSIKGNLDLPCGLYGKDPVMRSMALSETLVYPVRTDSPVRIMYLAGTSETPDRRTVSVFFQALKGLESAFFKKNGKGIGKTFESGTETRTICLFEKYPYFGERYCRVTFSTYSSELKKFASDLLKWSSGGGPGAEFLSAYGEILKEIRLRPVNETLPEPSERGTIREFCTEEEWRKNKSSGNAREELKETLDDLVRSGKDPEKTLSQLYEIYLNQTKERQKKLAGNVCADYALARHLPVPEPGLVRNREEACIYFEHFLRGNRKARPDRDMFLELAPGIGETAAGLFDEKGAEIVCKILSNVDNERLKNKWIGLYGICRKFTFETTLYRGLGCETRTQIAYAGFSKNDFFAKQLGKLIEGVVTITALSSMDLPPV
ncbi:MAG: hypothetical protein J5494_07920, partial [Candidatus Methanomethylophilaceae archaeon]|nr:hypothetical protein [Candidatus Methanomethylophilaceae archaeon]